MGDVQPALFERLQEVGLYRVFLGVEAGNDTSLRRFRKGFTARQALRAVRQLRAMGLEVQTGYIAFEPYASPEKVRANVHFLGDALEHRGNPAKYLLKLTPHHGTAL